MILAALHDLPPTIQFLIGAGAMIIAMGVLSAVLWAVFFRDRK